MPKSARILAFRCDFRSTLCEDDEGGLHLAEYNGELFVSLDDDDGDDMEQRAGTTRLFVLNTDAAENDNLDLVDLLDQRSETAAFIPLIGDEAGNFSKGVRRLLGEEIVWSRNLLILDRLEIDPKFRGQELGLKFMRAAITRFGMGCRLAALKPFPLQFEGAMRSAQTGDVDPVGTPLQSRKPPNERELRTAAAKLKGYYARAGFVALKGLELMILDLARER